MKGVAGLELEILRECRDNPGSQHIYDTGWEDLQARGLLVDGAEGFDLEQGIQTIDLVITPLGRVVLAASEST